MRATHCKPCLCRVVFSVRCTVHGASWFIAIFFLLSFGSYTRFGFFAVALSGFSSTFLWAFANISHICPCVCVCDCACMWCAWLFLRRSLCAVFSLIWRVFCTQHTHEKIFFFNYFDSDACVRLCADAGLCREYFATDFQPFTETKKRNGPSKSVTFVSYMHTNCWFCISEADSRPCKCISNRNFANHLRTSVQQNCPIFRRCCSLLLLLFVFLAGAVVFSRVAHLHHERCMIIFGRLDII